MDNVKLQKNDNLCKRATNFSKNEEERLVALVLKHRNVLENKKTDAATSKKKDETWRKLAYEFNANNNQFRSAKAIREKYSNMKRNLRRMKAAVRREYFDISGSLPPKEKSNTGEVIDELCDVIGISINSIDNRLNGDFIEETNIFPEDVKEKCYYFDEQEKSSELIEEKAEECIVIQPTIQLSQFVDNSITDIENSSVKPKMSEPLGKTLQRKGSGRKLGLKYKKPVYVDSENKNLLVLKKQILEEQLKKLRNENEHAIAEHLLRVELLQLQIKELKDKTKKREST